MNKQKRNKIKNKVKKAKAIRGLALKGGVHKFYL
jgi:hypothetical protein